MLSVLEIDTIPNLEGFRCPVKVFLVETVELNDCRIACDDLDLVTL